MPAAGDRRPRRLAEDAGSGTAWVLGVAACVLLVSLVATSLASVAVARHRAAAAADLAALAAASKVLGDERTACAAAHRVAGAQGALVRACTVTGDVVEVEVWVPVRVPGTGEGTGVRGRARAGPATAPP